MFPLRHGHRNGVSRPGRTDPMGAGGPTEMSVRVRVPGGPRNPMASASKRSSPRPISTGRLNTLPCVHLRPIYLVVCEGPYSMKDGRSHLGASFALRCFQRLSLPNVANQPCRWRDNWHTRGPSAPVLSYWGQLPSNLLRPRRIGTELSHDVLTTARVPL